MPRIATFTCVFCKKTVTKAVGNAEPLYCSRACYSEARIAEIEERIGESIADALRRLYIDERKSYRQISTILKINARTVMRYLERTGVEPRHGGEAVKIQWEGNSEARRAAARHNFMINCGPTFGANNPNWRGGSKSSTYSGKRWCKYADSIRARDNYRCTRCGMENQLHLSLYGKSLCVHHIVPRLLSNDDHPSNLRSLCIPCHQTVEAEFCWLL